MVFESPVFKGHVLSRFFFFYHFLPVYVFLLVCSLRIILQFAFDLQADLSRATRDSPWIHIPWHPNHLVSLFFKWIMLLIICLGVVITNMVFVRFMFDSLPVNGHPKMRKNGVALMRMLQRSFLRTGLSPLNINRSIKVMVVLLAIIPLMVYRGYYSAWECDQVAMSFRTATPPPLDGSIWKQYWQQPQPQPQPPSSSSSSSPNATSCDFLFKGLLTYWLVVWQCCVVAVSMYTRPNVYVYQFGNRQQVQAYARQLKMNASRLRAQELSAWRPLGSSRGSNTHTTATTTTTTTDEDEDVVSVELMHRHVHVMGKLEQTFLDDDNWDYVIGDASYAGLLMATMYFITLSFFADGGLIYGIHTFLIVSSAQVSFYAALWFLTHMAISMSDALTFTAWLIVDRQWLVGAAVAAFATVMRLVYEVYNHNIYVVVLCGYAMFCILPVATFVGHHYMRRRRAASSSSSSSQTPPSLSSMVIKNDTCPWLGGGPPPKLASSDDVASCYGVRSMNAAVVDKQRRPPEPPKMRYRVYAVITMLLGLVIVVALVSTVQRAVMIFKPATHAVPHQFFMARPNGPQRDHSFSVVLTIRNVSLASGHVTMTTATATTTAAPSPPLPLHDDNGMCSQQVYGLSLADYALLAQLAYLPQDGGQFDDFARTLFPDFVLRNASVLRPEGTRVVWYEMYSSARNVTIVAIRGTTAFELSDWLADVDVWLEAGAWQLFARFLPGLAFWPSTLLSHVFSFVSAIVDALLPGAQSNHARYYLPVMEHVARIDGRVALVGHSLGGGIAKIVGALLGHKVVSLSGPGMVESRGKFGVQLDAINCNIINIVPEGDMIARIGRQGGIVVHVPCSNDRFDMCHAPMNTACTLFNQCGGRGRGHHTTGATVGACHFEPHTYHAFAWRLWHNYF